MSCTCTSKTVCNFQLDSVVPRGEDAFMQKELKDLKDTIRVNTCRIINGTIDNFNKNN